MKKRLLVIIVSGFLFSCAETSSSISTNKIAINAPQTNTENVKYTCNRDTLLSVTFSTPNSGNDKKIAIINSFGNQAIILPNKVAASGFLYSNGKYSLRGKGKQATWTIGRMAPFRCSVGDELIYQEDVK
ncbi:MAG: membrane-bound inhibitor of C-type lysozyme [Cocleimonas sp.]|jgi:membrane-bound inhibitor of C-type lysozyme|tara:strand:- start:1715 stop:2104 length:390 start_codon:yes stop_codon:yes gene_type:complete